MAVNADKDVPAPHPNAPVQDHLQWFESLLSGESSGSLSEMLDVLRSMFCSGATPRVLTQAYSAYAEKHSR